MASILGLKGILEWERLSLFDHFSYVEMIKFLMIKTIFFCRLSTVYQYTPFVVTSLAYGEPRPVYEGLDLVGGCGEGTFSNMGGSITCVLDFLLHRRFYT
jgi:hypothetical protein